VVTLETSVFQHAVPFALLSLCVRGFLLSVFWNVWISSKHPGWLLWSTSRLERHSREKNYSRIMLSIALIPVITILGLTFGVAFSGAAVLQKWHSSYGAGKSWLYGSNFKGLPWCRELWFLFKPIGSNSASILNHYFNYIVHGTDIIRKQQTVGVSIERLMALAARSWRTVWLELHPWARFSFMRILSSIVGSMTQLRALELHWETQNYLNTVNAQYSCRRGYSRLR